MTAPPYEADNKRLYAYEQAISPEAWDARFQGLERLERVELDIIARLTARQPGQPPRRVLDIGCGTGRMHALYPDETYIGVDRSRPFLRYCRERREAGHAHFLLADLDRLPFPGGSFDLLLVIGTLESETDPARRMKDLLCYLRPGGRLVFTLQNKRNLPGRLASALSRGYRQTFWGRRQLRDALTGVAGHVEIATSFLLPPGVPRALFRTVIKGRRARRLVLKPYVALERLQSRSRLHLGYEWVVSITREDSPHPAGGLSLGHPRRSGYPPLPP